ncbi:MAG: HAMP domain-containing sensor histidine kinase [Thermomicrobiales bacterium]
MSIRARLTLLYGLLFFVAGLMLLVLLYAMLVRALDPAVPLRPFVERVQEQTQDVREQNDRPIEEQLADARSDERRSALRQVRVRGMLALVVTGGVALVLGWVVSGSVLSPIRDITLHAQQANAKTLDQRIGLAGPDDELKELADTIDGMLERLQDAFESQRRFSAEASHELRTPLAIMRAEADVALASPDATERETALATSIIQAVDRSERLVDGLLALARSESSLRDRDEVDLAELVGNVVGEQVIAADQAGIELDLTLDPAVVNGDRALLWRLAGNLIENGIRHGVRGGWLNISVGTNDGFAELKVANNGQTIPPEQVERLFRPFEQGDHVRPSSGGLGLGLSIVRAVTDAHDGTISASANPGGGLTVIVRIPSVAA